MFVSVSLLSIVGTPVASAQREAARLFNVYHSAAIAAVFTALAMRPSTHELAVIAALCCLSTSVCALTFWMEWSVAALEVFSIPPTIAPVMVRAAQGMASILVVLSTTALWKALMLRALAQIVTSREAALKLHKLMGTTDAHNNATFLTEHQRVLLGIPACKRKLSGSPTCGGSSSSILLVPVHPGFEKESSNGAGWGRRGSAGIGAGSNMCPTAAVISPRGPFSVQVSSYPMEPHGSTSPALPQDHHFPSPWSSLRSRREVIKNEENFIEFLADVDENILGKGAPQTATPFLPNSSCGVRSVGMNSSLVSHPGSGSTPRVFPLFPKGIAPPKLKERELPGPMSLEQFYGGLRQLGILESIEYWRDSLRQWFSSILLKPLVHKLDTSHWQVMAGAAKLGIAINVGHIGGRTGEHFVPVAAATTDEWLTPFGPDEDALMHQLRACLLQARDMRPPPPTSLFGLQNVMQEKAVNPAIQECLDAITEHQRLRALMKGDWGKGLLPLTTMRADYSVHRVRELANGSCAKQFDWSGTEALHHDNSCNPELPSDPHLMLYLFCALLEHPQWVLHDHPDAQWGVNPLFVAATPHKERIPDTYIAVLPHAPGYLHAGACVLCIGKQRPPVFALYWDLKLQFSFQGRSALWDAILLLCHRIRVAHGGVVRGIRLDSPALILSSVMSTLYPTLCS